MPFLPNKPIVNTSLRNLFISTIVVEIRLLILLLGATTNFDITCTHSVSICFVTIIFKLVSTGNESLLRVTELLTPVLLKLLWFGSPLPCSSENHAPSI